LLAEFMSIVDAVQSGVAIQKELRSRNDELPDEKKMAFRIGINLGDVIQEGDRIYGDGVNIAARLEGLAEPGGICISKSAFEYIESKLPYGYEYLGEKSAKNMAKPVTAYRVSLEPRVMTGKKTKDKKSVTPHRNTILFGAIAVLLVVVAGGVWQFYLRHPSIEPASAEKMAYPLPEKPSIAVLPFVNMSEDADQEYFSDGLTEEIISALSSVPKLFVIARNSTFTYKGKAVKVQEVSEELGVRYVLEGSVRKSADQVRITAQLVDALDGHHLWAERYDRKLGDIFRVQDEITKKIISSMQVKLTEGEAARSAARGTDDLKAYLKYLQAHENYNRGSVEGNASAKQLANQVIAVDPDYAMAYVVLARTYILDYWIDRREPQKEAVENAEKLLKKAIELDDNCAEAHGQLGWVYIIKQKYDEAISQAEKALTLAPNSAESHYMLGKTLTFAGRLEDSISEYKLAIRLNPIPPHSYFWSLGLSYAALRNYEEAIKCCKKAIDQNPDALMARIVMTSIYIGAGREEEARAQAAEVMRINPHFSLERFSKTAGPRLINHLRKAGLK
jgi:adenylate cyclase